MELYYIYLALSFICLLICLYRSLCTTSAPHAGRSSRGGWRGGGGSELAYRKLPHRETIAFAETPVQIPEPSFPEQEPYF